MDGLTFEQHGAARRDRAALSLLDKLEAALEDVAQERAGVRLYDNAKLADLLKSGSALADMATHLGPAAMPVRAILFDKTPATSWALGWHQDRSVAVRERVEVPGWGPWSTKSGVHHVEPPFAVIEQMVTLRVHLDRVPIDNAPLLVAPGSHRFGRVAQREIDVVVKRCGTATCLAERGDVWVYATPILHASAASSGHAHRRVLQIDYAAEALAHPLAWLGV